MTKFHPVWPLKSFSKFEISAEYQGERIYLSPPHLSHFHQWLNVRRDNEKHLRPFEPEWAKNHLSLNFYKRRLERQKIESVAERGAFFLIMDKNNHHVLGGINLNNIQYGAAHSASLGYWLAKEHQGQGYMNEAVRLIIDYAFNNLSLRRLNAACLPHNQRSINLLLKAGFMEEGYAKKYLQINGIWQDHKLYGLVNNSL